MKPLYSDPAQIGHVSFGRQKTSSVQIGGCSVVAQVSHVRFRDRVLPSPYARLADLRQRRMAMRLCPCEILSRKQISAAVAGDSLPKPLGMQRVDDPHRPR